MTDSVVDPRVLAAITRARQAHARATGQWVSYDEDDPAAEAEQLARDALGHLIVGRWDDAQGCSDALATLAEENGEDLLWREFALLVDEAAEIGRAAVAVGASA